SPRSVDGVEVDVDASAACSSRPHLIRFIDFDWIVGIRVNLRSPSEWVNFDRIDGIRRVSELDDRARCAPSRKEIEGRPSFSDGVWEDGRSHLEDAHAAPKGLLFIELDLVSV